MIRGSEEWLDFYYVRGIPPEVVEVFGTLALGLINDKWEHYSSDAILHRIRWHFRVEKGQRSFKCNDHWTAYLARWFVFRYPQHRSFFELRALGVNHENYEYFQGG